MSATERAIADVTTFPQPTPRSPVYISAERARGIAEAAQAAQTAQREFERIQAVQRVRYLEALCEAHGINPDGFDITQAPDGSLEVKERAAEGVAG